MNIQAVNLLAILLIILNIPFIFVMWKSTIQTLNVSSERFVLKLLIPNWVKPSWFLIGYGLFATLTVLVVKIALPEYSRIITTTLLSWVFLWMVLFVVAAIILVLAILGMITIWFFLYFEELERRAKWSKYE